ncbi:hypothetical protein [Sneathiella chinensis]|nr:hypothetical protein [Sneathiella chinensis]
MSQAPGGGSASSAPKGVVQHHEIGEMAHFLNAFGHSKEEAVKTLLASSLQIVGLEEVKKQYASRWKQIEKTVYKATEAFFSRKLRKEDRFVRLREGRFAIIFRDMSREEGQARASELARELVTKLFGEIEGAELVTVEVMVLDEGVMDAVDDFDSLEDLIQHFERAIHLVDEREKQEFEESEEVLTVQYRPCLNPRKKMISMMEIVPCRQTGSQTERLAGDDPMLNGSPRLRAELDIHTLKQTADAVGRLGKAGHKPLLLLTVAFETMANPYMRRKYAETLKTLPDYTSQRLVLNLEGIGSGIPNSRYVQIVSSVKTLVRGFSLEVAPGWNDYAAIEGLPVLAIAATVDPKVGPDGAADLFQAARSQKRKCILRSVASDDIARQALKLGVDYVCGPVIAGMLPAPGRPFSIRNL